MTDQIQETIRFYQWLKLAELVRFNSFSKLLELSSFTFQETFEDDKTLSRFSWYFDLVLEHFTCSENTNLYREIIKVVRHFLRRNYSRLRRLYRVRLLGSKFPSLIIIADLPSLAPRTEGTKITETTRTDWQEVQRHQERLHSLHAQWSWRYEILSIIKN